MSSNGAFECLRTIADRCLRDEGQAGTSGIRFLESAVLAQKILSAFDQIIPAAHATRPWPISLDFQVLLPAGHMGHIEQADEINRLSAALTLALM